MVASISSPFWLCPGPNLWLNWLPPVWFLTGCWLISFISWALVLRIWQIMYQNSQKIMNFFNLGFLLDFSKKMNSETSEDVPSCASDIFRCLRIADPDCVTTVFIPLALAKITNVGLLKRSSRFVPFFNLSACHVSSSDWMLTDSWISWSLGLRFFMNNISKFSVSRREFQ